MSIKDAISQDLDIPIEMIEDAVLRARHEVKIFTKDKRNGKPRYIHQPSSKTKTIQYWLIENIYKAIPIHPSAAAYVKEKSILDNAEAHRDGAYFLKIDFKDFFPSIRFDDLLPFIKNWHSLADTEWDLDPDALRIIRLCCFFKNDRLAIGYPCSPVISNIVMAPIDAEIVSLLRDTEKFGITKYTRYADDIIISTSKKGASKEILKEIRSLISNKPSPLLKINEDKTKLSSRSGGSAIVTGLRVCADKHITLHKNQKKHITLLLSLYKKGVLPQKENESLRGHLAYAKHIDPRFYSKISMKYFKEMREIQPSSSENHKEKIASNSLTDLL